MKKIEQESPRENNRLNDFLLFPERSLIRLSIPIIIGMGMHILYSVVDMIFVGRLGGDAIAAVTFSGSFLLLMFSFSSVSVGSQSLIARWLGAKDNESANNTAIHSLLLGTSLGIAFFFIGRVYTQEILTLVGAREQTLSLGTTYLEILFLGSPFLFFSAFSRAILIGEGDTKTPVIIMTSATLLNIILDPIFIYTLGWGVPGAAWATVVAMMTSFTAYFYFLFVRKGSFVKITPNFFHPSGHLLGQMLKVGLPASLGQLVMSIGGMCLHRIISIFGSQAVAGYGLGGKVDMLIILPFIGISTALLSLVGIYYGSNRGDLIRRIASFAIKKTMQASVVCGCFVYFFAEPILHIFTGEEAVIEIGKNYLHFIVFAYPMIAFGMNTGRILQGLGLGLPSLVITSTRVILVSVPLAYLFTRVLSLDITSIWIAILISGCISTFISFLWLRHSLNALPEEQGLLESKDLPAEASSVIH